MKPIDPRQHVLWFRLRRLGCWGFTLLGGGVMAPLITCMLYGSVVWFYRYPLMTFIDYGVVIWVVTAPLYIGCFLWTWSHMEKRYRVTLATSCPRCGYSLAGGSGGGRCPECGEPSETR